MVHLPVTRFLLRDHADSFYLQRTRLLETGEPLTAEWQMVTGRGKPFWARVAATVRCNDSGQASLRVVLSDISTLKKAESALTKSEAFNHAALDSLDAQIAVLDHSGTIMAVNRSWRRFALENKKPSDPHGPRVRVGINYLAVCAASGGANSDGTVGARITKDGIQAVLSGRIPFYSMDYLCHSPLQQRWFTMRVTPLGDGVVVVHSDVTALKQAEQCEHFHRRILEQLAQDKALPKLLEAIVLGVERLKPPMLCSILLLDQKGKHLGQGVAPNLPEDYNAALDGIEIGLGVGSCGTAAYSGQRVIVEDIATIPYWPSYKMLAVQAGLSACWSQPILSSSGIRRVTCDGRGLIARSWPVRTEI